MKTRETQQNQLGFEPMTLSFCSLIIDMNATALPGLLHFSPIGVKRKGVVMRRMGLRLEGALLKKALTPAGLLFYK